TNVGFTPTPKNSDSPPPSLFIPCIYQPKRPIILFFTRHLGCPFPERDIRPPESTAWFAQILHAAFESYAPPSAAPAPSPLILQEHFSLFPDADRSLYKAYGIGKLEKFGSLFSSSMWESLGKLKAEGIVNRTTGWGSDRWAAHGGVGIDGEGIVKWYWKAERAEEEADWEEGCKALGP
ncbi:hypothetical protein FIBSPDRAFT_738163, partial [Athelia psychrophila]